MTNTLTEVIIDYLSQILFQIVLYTGVLCLSNQDDITSIKGILFLILFNIPTTLVRRYTDKLWKFLVATLMLCLGGIVLNQIVLGDKMIYEFIVFICFLGFVIRIRKSAKDFEHPDMLPFVIMAIIYIVMEFISIKHARLIVFISIFCYILLFLFESNYKRFKWYIESRRHTTIMAERKMKKVFNKHITIYMIGLAFIILLLSTISFQGLYQSIANNVSNLDEIEMKPNQMEVEEERTSDNMKELIEMVGKSSGPSIIWIILEKILSIVFYIIIAIVVVASVYIIIRGIYYGFYGRKKKKEEEVLFASVETREFIKKEKLKKKDLENENNQRKLLRKIYRKHMSGFWENTNCIPEVTTPSEQRSFKNAKGEEVRKEVVELYEVARYSNHDITKEDIVKMKNILKK